MNIERNYNGGGGIPMSGVGYVIVPSGSDTTEYVQRCYRNQTISISGGKGCSAMHNVKITTETLHNVKFPSGNKLGSAVVWIRDSFTNRPVVIGTLNSLNLSNTNQQRIFQEVGDKIVEVFLDALNGKINIVASGSSGANSEVNIRACSGKDEGDVVNLVSNDKINVEGKRLITYLTKNMDLTINDGEKDILHIVGDDKEFHVTDHWMNEAIFNEENVQILTAKFNVGEGKEQMILGNTLVDLLGQLIDAILNLTVLTPHGPSGTPVNAATFSNIKSKLETALSKLSNTD